MIDLADPYPYVPVKHPWVGGTRWKFLAWADIPSAVDPKRTYLRRLRIVQTPWFGLYLHWIYLPDDDRDPHDHPFTFWSLIVKGGYTERVWRVLGRQGFVSRHVFGTKTWKRWSFHKMPLNFAHMIDDLKPGTISLVFVGRKVSDWGFYTPHYMNWREYNDAKFKATQEGFEPVDELD